MGAHQQISERLRGVLRESQVELLVNTAVDVRELEFRNGRSLLLKP